jgi:hypothetical protein
VFSDILYQDFPNDWVYNHTERKGSERQWGHAIGRMYLALPSQGEQFYLRLLLTVTPRATSLLKTHDGVLYGTYREACLAHGLLQDDAEWKQCLQEAGEMQTGSGLKSLFAVILLNCA